jgi:hypothetical protein
MIIVEKNKNYTVTGKLTDKLTNTPTYKQWHLCCTCVQKEICYERHNVHVRLLHLDCELNSVTVIDFHLNDTPGTVSLSALCNQKVITWQGYVTEQIEIGCTKTWKVSIILILSVNIWRQWSIQVSDMVGNNGSTSFLGEGF